MKALEVSWLLPKVVPIRVRKGGEPRVGSPSRVHGITVPARKDGNVGRLEVNGTEEKSLTPEYPLRAFQPEIS
jgi:hypothetical protein